MFIKLFISRQRQPKNGGVPMWETQEYSVWRLKERECGLEDGQEAGLSLERSWKTRTINSDFLIN